MISYLVTQWVKNLPTMQETWVQSPGREDPLEKEMATHSSILAWEIPWIEEPGGATVRGVATITAPLFLHWGSSAAESPTSTDPTPSQVSWEVPPGPGSGNSVTFVPSDEEQNQ